MHKNMNDNTARLSTTAVQRTDVHRLSRLSSVRLDVSNDEREEMRAMIDNAMQSVGLVLETALQAMTNLRAVRAALLLFDADQPSLDLHGKAPDA